MRMFLLPLLLAFMVTQERQPAPTGNVQGVVRRGDTGEPIGGVQISMTRVGPIPDGVAQIIAGVQPGAQLTSSQVSAANAASQQYPTESSNYLLLVPVEPPGSYGAITDEDGRFVLKNVAPGKYSITAKREGFFAPFSTGALTANVTTAPFSIADGATVPAISLSMVAGGTISGRVSDKNRQAVVGASVSAFQFTYNLDGRGTLSPRVTKKTDDRGDFRLHWLPPGDYIVGSTPTDALSSSNKKETYERTFYPDSIDPWTAQRVTVKDGGVVSAINVVLRTVDTVKISGQVINSSPGPWNLNSLQLVPHDPRQFVDFSPRSYSNVASDRSNGQFEIRGVPPGSYELGARVPDANGITGSTLIEVGGEDLSGIRFPVHSPVQVKARIIYEGGTPSRATATSLGLEMRVTGNEGVVLGSYILATTPQALDFTTWNGMSQRGTAFKRDAPPDGSGIIVFQRVTAARFSFSAIGLPPGAAISDVRENGASVFDSGLKIGSDPPR